MPLSTDYSVFKCNGGTNFFLGGGISETKEGRREANFAGQSQTNFDHTARCFPSQANLLSVQ